MCAMERGEEIRRYQLVAPDGGWGYMILVAVILNFTRSGSTPGANRFASKFIMRTAEEWNSLPVDVFPEKYDLDLFKARVAITSFSGIFGMIFNDFIISIEMSTTAVNLLYGIHAVCFAITGFLTGPVLKVISQRQLAFIASTLLNVGNICTVFATSALPFFICQGILLSSGRGILYNLSCTVLNDYFVKKRLLFISLSQTISALAVMVAPQLVKWSLDRFDLTGTLILISAVSVHTFVASALMQPVAWHVQRIPVADDEGAKALLKRKQEEPQAQGNLQLSKSTCSDTKSESLANQARREEVPNYKGLMKMMQTVLDVSSMKSFIKSNACFGMPLCAFTDAIFMLMLPQALFSMAWSKESVAWALSLVGFGDITMRLVLMLMNKCFVKIGSYEIYIFGLAVAFVSRLGVLGSDKSVTILIFLTLMGVSRCTISVLPSLVISDSVAPEHFPSAMGISMVLFGAYSLVLGPTVGAVRDLTDNYATVFYILTSCFAVVMMFWIVELCYKRNKHKRVARKEQLAKASSKKASRSRGK